MEQNSKPSLFRQIFRESVEVIFKIHKDLSISTMEQNFKPSLFLQVVRELREVIFKKDADVRTCSVIGSYPNEKFHEVVEWTKEANKLINAIEGVNKTVYTNPEWCKCMISRMRDLCAKRRASNVSINTAQLSLRQQLYREIVLLINITSPMWRVYALTKMEVLTNMNFNVLSYMDIHVLTNMDIQLLNEVKQFLCQIKPQLQQNILEANSDWYHNKIAETRRFVDKCEPRFSLQSQGVGSFSIKLHEEFRCEIRLLTNLYRVDLNIFIGNISNDPDVDDKFMQELQEGINEMHQFYTEIKLQLKEKNVVKDSSWYHKKIAETRTLIGKRYLAFPLQSQHVGSSSINSKALPDDVGYDFFLSFRGEDTRHGFTRHLYEALHKEGFNVFMDDEKLKMGESISQVLVKAIESSKIAIIIFSPKYATSRWCLDEVVQILECKKKNGQLVWPIFYKVNITDVRHQKNSYEAAMSEQENKFGKNSEIVEKWRSSLFQVCTLKALEYKENDGRYESDIIKEIIKDAMEVFKDRV